MPPLDAQRWNELKATFAELADDTADNRARRLAALASADPQLHTTLEALLRADAHTGPLRHDAEPTGNLRVPDSDGADADPFDLAGRVISHFRVIDVLGRGGMGVVYRAEDVRLGRVVALKFLLPQYATSAADRQRFLREARAASALEHPNVCTIYEAGETEAGLFLAMACYAGVTLRERLETDAPLGIERAADIGAQVLRGLGAAHRAGIVHRDLKPGNLLIAADGSVRILDFGLAGARDDRGAGGTVGTGLPPGTIAYMSPEQLETHAADHRADLWSFGVVLHEMLTGRLPFRRGRDLSTIHSILNDTPLPPSRSRADVPAALDAVVLRLLARDPADRYATADEVLADLAAAASPPPGPLAKLGVLRAAAAVLALGATLLLGMVVLRPDGFRGAPGGAAAAAMEERSVAVLPFEDLSPQHDDEFFSDGIAEEILNALHQLPELRVTSRASAFSFRGSALAASEIARQLDVASLLGGTVRRTATGVRITAWLMDARTDREVWSRSFEGRLDETAAIQAEIARAVLSALEVQLATEHVLTLPRGAGSHAAHEAYLHGLFHWHRRTPSDVRQAIHFFEQAVGEDSTYANAHAGLALAYSVMPMLAGMRVDDAAHEVERAAARSLALDSTLVDPHAALGYIHHQQWRWDDAAREFRRALQLNPRHTTALQWSGEQEAKLGRPEEAERMLRSAVALDPLSAVAHVNLGLVLWLGGNVPAALAQFEHTAQLDPGFTIAHVFLMRARLAAGDVEGAVQSAREWATLSGEATPDEMAAYVRATAAGEADSVTHALLDRWEQVPNRLPDVVLSAALTGQTDRALGALERAFQQRSPHMSAARAGRWVEPLQNESRYRRLVAQMNFPDAP
jgi:eukaryotic-like serine/threonine-protein kinase